MFRNQNIQPEACWLYAGMRVLQALDKDSVQDILNCVQKEGDDEQG